jgi:hypothetical protein
MVMRVFGCDEMFLPPIELASIEETRRGRVKYVYDLSMAEEYTSNPTAEHPSYDVTRG